MNVSCCYLFLMICETKNANHVSPRPTNKLLNANLKIGLGVFVKNRNTLSCNRGFTCSMTSFNEDILAVEINMSSKCSIIFHCFGIASPNESFSWNGNHLRYYNVGTLWLTASGQKWGVNALAAPTSHWTKILATEQLALSQRVLTEPTFHCPVITRMVI